VVGTGRCSVGQTGPTDPEPSLLFMYAAQTGGQPSVTLLQAYLSADDSRSGRQAIRHDQGAPEGSHPSDRPDRADRRMRS
jgi:hypothetical protein